MKTAVMIASSSRTPRAAGRRVHQTTWSSQWIASCSPHEGRSKKVGKKKKTLLFGGKGKSVKMNTV